MERYTIARIKSLCESDRETAAKELDLRATILDTNAQEDYNEQGVISWGVNEFKLWEVLGWGSFTDWFDDRWAGSKSSAWESYITFGILKPFIPEPEIKAMQRNKRKKLADCPSDAPKKDPEVWEKAKDKHVTEREFVEHVNREYHQHLECRGPYLNPSDSQKALYEEACAKVKAVYGDATMTRELCFEVISQHFLETAQESGAEEIASQMEGAVIH